MLARRRPRNKLGCSCACSADPQRRAPRACGRRRGRTMWRATRRRARAGPARRGPARGLPRGVVAVERRERPATSPPPGLGNHAGDVPCRAPERPAQGGRTVRPQPVRERVREAWSTGAELAAAPVAGAPSALRRAASRVSFRSVMIGRDAAVEAAEPAAGWLPDFASALHRDARAPVNLTPIAGLERHLHRLQGDARLALRAVREAVLERNREGRTA